MVQDKWARIIGIPIISLIIPLIQDFEEMIALNYLTLQHFITCLVFILQSNTHSDTYKILYYLVTVNMFLRNRAVCKKIALNSRSICLWKDMSRLYADL